jgi:hypothetical protein
LQMLWWHIKDISCLMTKHQSSCMLVLAE